MCKYALRRYIHCWHLEPFILSHGRHKNGRCKKARETGKDCKFDEQQHSCETIEVWGVCGDWEHMMRFHRKRKDDYVDVVVENHLKKGIEEAYNIPTRCLKARHNCYDCLKYPNTEFDQIKENGRCGFCQEAWDEMKFECPVKEVQKHLRERRTPRKCMIQDLPCQPS
ncbi:hypothetical protein BDZ45DRAFT_735002 [Acephala macrosclerotiorum]|nr:hypothetical protein BDZ45DRAFT_735002 [Acephala macrosclerotiorum]